jgi:hypothetical protein
MSANLEPSQEQKSQHLRLLGILGLVIALVFSVCVTIPFYFQGYADLLKNCGFSIREPSVGLACVHSPPGWIDETWTRSRLIGLFSSLLSSKFNEFGLIALWLGLLAFSFGQLSTNRMIDKTLRALGLTFILYTAVDLYKYNVIADWLE